MVNNDALVSEAGFVLDQHKQTHNHHTHPTDGATALHTDKVSAQYECDALREYYFGICFLKYCQLKHNELYLEHNQINWHNSNIRAVSMGVSVIIT